LLNSCGFAEASSQAARSRAPAGVPRGGRGDGGRLLGGLLRGGEGIIPRGLQTEEVDRPGRGRATRLCT